MIRFPLEPLSEVFLSSLSTFTQLLSHWKEKPEIFPRDTTQQQHWKYPKETLSSKYLRCFAGRLSQNRLNRQETKLLPKSNNRALHRNMHLKELNVSIARKTQCMIHTHIVSVSSTCRCHIPLTCLPTGIPIGSMTREFLLGAHSYISVQASFSVPWKSLTLGNPPGLLRKKEAEKDYWQ